jgi:hypothetical protein
MIPDSALWVKIYIELEKRLEILALLEYNGMSNKNFLLSLIILKLSL